MYDLMSPVIYHKDTAISGVIGQGRANEKPSENSSMLSAFAVSSTMFDRRQRKDETPTPHRTTYSSSFRIGSEAI